MAEEEQVEIGHVKPLRITEEMEESYISYAMSVIVSRALPDARDGLKPVQRRILFAMDKMGLTPGSSFRKSATVVGSVLGHYHPHSDTAAYEAMVRMGQDLSLRYPLVEPQGNFGHPLDGDPPASMRYTEAKLSKLGKLMLRDIGKDTVDLRDNFDGTRKEPVVLPSPVPQLLLNGCLGIAVGMATNIPPHNLTEVCEAAVHLVDNPKATTEDILEFVQGPDFPTGGVIYDKESITEAYSQGKGSIVCRARAEIVRGEKSPRIVVSEIPYGVNKPKMLQKIARLVHDGKLKKIRDIRDESGQEGVRIVLELKRGASPKRILNFLYKKTRLQHKFHMNMVALVEGIQPQRVGLLSILNGFVEHRREVVERRTRHEKDKAEARAHILEGFEIAIADIDQVIETIKKSEDRKDAQKNLMKGFDLTEKQADAILNMRLSSLARMEREKIEKELKRKKERIGELTEILENPEKVDEVLKKELEKIIEEFGDQRKTTVFEKKAAEISPEDLIPEQDVVVVLTREGSVKRVKSRAYRAQRRGGKGVIGAKTKEGDVIEHLVYANTRDLLYFFTDSGKAFKTRVHEIPAAKRSAQGENIMNILQLTGEERVLAVLPLRKEELEEEHSYFLMATEGGKVKKSDLSEFRNVRRNGLLAINLRKGDLLREVKKCKKGDQVVLVTEKGKAIRFEEEDVRSMGRGAMGVKGIDLEKGDKVVGMDVVKDKKGEILTITAKGYGKRTALSEYRTQKRGGKGLKTADLTEKTGEIAIARVLSGEKEHILIISEKAQIIKTRVEEISRLGRSTQGVRVMDLKKGDRVACLSCV